MSTNDWKKVLKESFSTPLELLELLEIDSEEPKVSLNRAKKYKI
ncbi:EF-P beta-lysylation protein EpmB, partial [Francisella tularensis subsp. holarctica]|nr:EF-P beta-lysylation protein EpmB [Francisella tularensis subsp. holarctica]